MERLKNGLEITYLGHSTFKILSPGGKSILIDPWLTNPLCPEKFREIEDLDIMAVTHGHFDHIGEAVSIGKEKNPAIIANWEICEWFGLKGLGNCYPMNKGGTYDVDGIKFTMTHAQHSSGIKDDDGNIVYGGEPGGFVIEFENGFKIYHAGDTNIFSDMRLIAEIYKPQLAMLPIGDVFTMSPLEASYACRFLKPKFVIPIHYATFPVLTGTPEQLQELTEDIEDMEILALKPGETLT
ncbi:MAG: metal-dependent hydrolase [Thermodesulfobacteriota bacterium]